MGPSDGTATVECSRKPPWPFINQKPVPLPAVPGESHDRLVYWNTACRCLAFALMRGFVLVQRSLAQRCKRSTILEGQLEWFQTSHPTTIKYIYQATYKHIYYRPKVSVGLPQQQPLFDLVPTVTIVLRSTLFLINSSRMKS